MAVVPDKNAEIRPVAFPRDGKAIADLMELSFGDLLDSSSRNLLAAVRRWSNQGKLVWELARMAGFVQIGEWLDGLGWYDGERAVGNISITASAFGPDAWMIGNIAVHPDFRQRGIARALVRAALEDIRRRAGARVFLQVDASNATARKIYAENGFCEIANRNLWERGVKSLSIARLPSRVHVRPCRGEEWLQEYTLLRELAPAGITWNLPLTERRIRPSLLRQVERYLGEESEVHWLAWQDSICMGALLSVNRIWEEQAVLFCCAEASRPLAESLLDRWLPDIAEHRSINLETDSFLPAEVMLRYGFRLARSLVWMEHSLS
jgi:ribosomal protein S18 acetylase RimI-like enzyme